MPLTHPFDDPVFAAVATANGFSYDDLPNDYSPDVMFQNSAHAEDLPGMPYFHFIPGDDQYDGEIRVNIGQGVDYRWLAGSPYVNLDQHLPESIIAALPGVPISQVVAIPGIPGAPIAGAVSDAGHTSIQLQPYGE